MTEQSADSRRKVVYVEDEPTMIELVELILKGRGYEVIGANGGREALELIPQVKPDIVLLDLMMPDMNGWDVYQKMKADEYMKTIPVIIVTAKAQTIDKMLGLHIAKVQDYITKPFSPSELVESVNRVLSRQANGEEAEG